MVTRAVSGCSGDTSHSAKCKRLSGLPSAELQLVGENSRHSSGHLFAVLIVVASDFDECLARLFHFCHDHGIWYLGCKIIFCLAKICNRFLERCELWDLSSSEELFDLFFLLRGALVNWRTEHRDRFRSVHASDFRCVQFAMVDLRSSTRPAKGVPRPLRLPI